VNEQRARILPLLHFCGTDARSERTATPDIVRLQKGEPFAPGDLHSGISRRARPCVRIMPKQGNSRIVGKLRWKPHCGTRTIVNNQQFNVLHLLAVMERVKLRYRRTLIGPLWLTLSLGAMVFGIGALYAGLFRSNVSTYIPYLATGLVVWMFISTTITEGCTIFISSASQIKATTMPMLNYIFRSLWKNLIIFAHNMIIIAVLWLVFGLPSVMTLPWFFLGLFFNIVMLFGVVLILSMICTRFRDVPQIVIAAMQLILPDAHHLDDRYSSSESGGCGFQPGSSLHRSRKATAAGKRA